MAKGQTKQATQQAKDIYGSAPQTFSPVTQPLTGVPGEARTGYENLINTGTAATSGQGAVDYMNAAGSSIAATNSVLQEQLNRERAAQGQGAGGGEYEALSRLSAQQQADANLKASVALNQQRTAAEEAGLRGLTGLDQQLLQALGLQVGSQEEATSIMANLSKNPGLFDNILRAIGTVTGTVSGGSGSTPTTWSVVA